MNELKYFDQEIDKRTARTGRAKAYHSARARVVDLADHVGKLAKAQNDGQLLEWFAQYLSLRLGCDATLGVFDSYLHAVVDPDVDLSTVGEAEERPGLEVLRVALDKRIIAELRKAGFSEDVVGPTQQIVRHVVAVVLGSKGVGLASEVDEHAHDSSPSVGSPASIRDTSVGSPNPTEGGAFSPDTSPAQSESIIENLTVADPEEFARAVANRENRLTKLRDL